MNKAVQYQSQASLLTFPAMAATYCLGSFNDNFFKQAALLLAVAAGLQQLQGWAATLYALPFVLFSAHGGWCADCFVKRTVIIASKGLEVVAMLCGAVGLFTGSWPLILAMIFLMGLQSAFFGPSLNGSIPELYSGQKVARVNALLRLTTTLSILAGIATAGFCLDAGVYTSFGGPGLVAICATLVSVIGLITSFFIPSFRNSARYSAAPHDKAFPWLGPLHSLRYLVDICRDRELCTAILADAWFYFFASIAVLVINALGGQQLGLSKSATSLLSVALMVGVCIGSLLAAKFMRVESWSSFLVLSGVGMAGGVGTAALAAQAPSALLMAALSLALILTGIAGGLFLIPVTTILQVRPAAHEKGRVLGAAAFSVFTAIFFSGLLYNVMTSFFLPTTNFILLAIMGSGASMFFWALQRYQG